jgi:hypothetical protein
MELRNFLSSQDISILYALKAELQKPFDVWQKSAGQVSG